MDDMGRLETAVSDIDREIEIAERRLEKLRLERLGADALLARLNRSNRPAGVSVSAGTATGNTAVIEAILAATPEGLSLGAIEEQVAERGLSLNADQVRSAVTYLKRRNKAESPKRGHWRLIATTDAETDADTSVSETPIPAIEEGGGSHEATPTPSPQDAVQPNAELLLGASGT